MRTVVKGESCSISNSRRNATDNVGEASTQGSGPETVAGRRVLRCRYLAVKTRISSNLLNSFLILYLYFCIFDGDEIRI